MLDDQRNREALIKAIMERNGSSGDVMTLAQTLLSTNQERNQKEIDQMEQDKEAQMEKIKLQIVAENEAEVQ